jgi:hypothetical protein
MEQVLLHDEHEFPSDEVLAKHLGKAKSAWDAFASSPLVGHEMALEWRYYRDGHSWLCKAVRKKKTVCWVSVWHGFFKTTFYFTAKNDGDIEALAIAPELKAAYRAHPPIGKLRPMTVEVKNKKALQDVYALMDYKIGLR